MKKIKNKQEPMIDLANHIHTLFKKGPSNPDTRLWRTARSLRLSGMPARWDPHSVGVRGDLIAEGWRHGKEGILLGS